MISTLDISNLIPCYLQRHLIYSIVLIIISSVSLNAQNCLSLTSTLPDHAANSINRSANIVLNFDHNINASTVTPTNIVVTGSQTGHIQGTFAGGGSANITFNPSTDFKPGEVIRVTITRNLEGTGGCILANPYHFEFRAISTYIYIAGAVSGIPHIISTSADGAESVYAADMDNDGDMDAVSASRYDNKLAWYENTNQTFTPHNISTSASEIFSMCVTDLDGDHDLDVLRPWYLTNRIYWHSNDGNQNFTAQTISNSATGVSVLDAADINGDGFLDVVSGSEFDDEIVWYENDSNQNFIPHLVTDTASTVKSIYTVDIDGDGDLDILGALDNKVMWYENDSLLFTPHPVFTSITNTISVYSADMDDDGDMDVLCASFSENKIMWFKNNNQIFIPDVITTSANGVTSIFATDVDGDGNMDVLSASSNNDKITWYENDGSQIFTPHTITNTADLAQSVYAADMDGDGDMDILSASLFDDKIAWYEVTCTDIVNSTSDSICAGDVYNFYGNLLDTSGIYTQTFLQADGCGDSIIELSLTVIPKYNEYIDTAILQGNTYVSPSGKSFTSAGIYMDTIFNVNSCDSIFTINLSTICYSIVSTTPAQGEISVDRSDNIIINFDTTVNAATVSDTNIIITGSQTGLISGTFTGGGSSTITFDPAVDFQPCEVIGITVTNRVKSSSGCSLPHPQHFEFRVAPSAYILAGATYNTNVISTNASFARSVFAADMDSDGDIDVLSAAEDEIVWYRNINQIFTGFTISTSANDPYWVDAADIDGDSDMDVLSASSNKITWYENDGFQNFTSHDLSTSASFATSVHATDVDNDGDMDILGTARNDNTIMWYENDGNENFSTHTITSNVDYPYSVYATDLDKDGDIDFLSASANDNKIAWYENNGWQNFNSHTIATTASAARCVYAIDMDSDDDIDVLSAASNNDQIAWYENDGSQNFSIHIVSDSANFARAVYAVDIDGDGDVDILSASEYDDKIVLYENDGNQSFTPHNVSTTADGAHSVYAADIDGDGFMEILSASKNDNKIAWYDVETATIRVEGQVFRDNNGNGIKDTSESGLPGITITANPGGYTGVSNVHGDYVINIGSLGTFNLEVQVPSRYYCSASIRLSDTITAPPGNTHTITLTPMDSVSENNNFGLKPPMIPCGTINGSVFDDLNGNAIDDSEPGKSSVHIELSTGQSAVTDITGEYSVDVPFNVPITVSVNPAPGSYFCGAYQQNYTQTYPTLNGTYSVTTTPASPISNDNDFGLHQANSSYDVSLTSIRAFAGVYAGQDFIAWLAFKSQGNIPDTCRLRLRFDNLVSFLSADLPPTNVSSNYIEWVFPPGQAPAWQNIQMIFSLGPGAFAGSSLTWSSAYSCDSPDGCSGNDTLTVMETVLSGPLRRMPRDGFNYMEVEHTGNTQNEISLADSVFSYNIMFQNTGSDTIYHMTIIDTLSQYLNPTTLSTPFSSHAYRLSIPSPNILIWEFDNIILPDSASDLLNSYGFMQYNIHIKPNLTPGTTIKNRATTYFNYNRSLTTNTVTTTVLCPGQFSTISAGICQGDVYSFNGNLLDSSGVFTAIYHDVFGCDSIVELSLNVTPDIYVSISDTIMSGSIYTLPSGTTTNTAGTYIDTVNSTDNCDTIYTVNLDVMSSTGNLALSSTGLFTIHPNPAHASVTISIDENMIGGLLTLVETSGKIILEQSLLDLNTKIPLRNFANGLYFVRINSKNSTAIKKLMISK